MLPLPRSLIASASTSRRRARLGDSYLTAYASYRGLAQKCRLQLDDPFSQVHDGPWGPTATGEQFRWGGHVSYAIDLGPWGIGHDDETYGRALAGLGVSLAGLEDAVAVAWLDRATDPAALVERLAYPPTSWRIGPILRLIHQHPGAWEDVASRLDASEVARAWERALEDLPDAAVRLAIEPGPRLLGPYQWLAERLARSGASVSAFVAAPELSSREDWQWPLRVGLLDDRESNELRARLDRSEVSARLFRTVNAASENAMDLWLLPHALPDALAQMLRMKDRVRAECIAVLGGLGAAMDQEAPTLFTVAQAKCDPWGILLATVPPAAAGAWFSALVNSLARDDTLDVAVGSAMRTVKQAPAVLFAGQEPIEYARITRVAARLAQQLPGVPPDHVAVPADALKTLGIEGVAHRKELIEIVTNSGLFLADEAGATAVASMAEAVEAAAPILAEPSPARWVQVELRALNDPEPLLLRLWRSDAAHTCDVWIGSEAEGVRAPTIFPEADLPAASGGHELTVVFAELGGRRTTSTATIRLPHKGRSDKARFYFWPHGNMFRARIIVLFRNRVLQTALLEASVGDSALDGPSEIRLITEAAVRPNLEDLEKRRSFGVALVLNHDEVGRGGTAVRGGRAVPLDLGNVQPAIDKIVDRLSRIAYEQEKFRDGLDSAETVKLLYRLALQGVLLHDDLMNRQRLVEVLGDTDRIQVLATDPNQVLPLEFVYEFPAPSSPKLCPNAKAALLKGECDPRHHHVANNGLADVVCPAGFWGMQRIIERHLADPEGLAGKGPYQIASEPTTGRDSLSGLQGALFAASHLVEKSREGATLDVENVLASATSDRSKRARTWDEWVDVVRADVPSLLVLLAHSSRDAEADQAALQIEEAEMCLEAHINQAFVRGGDAPPPLVFLLGCDTAVVSYEYQTFVTRFRNAGAALVVGTLATIAGRHAADLAMGLVTALESAGTGARSWTAFGDLLRDVRRRLLADGHVMALCLTAYGDADWKFPTQGS